jgi:hypothetical protein
MRLVGNGMKATVIKKATLRRRNSRSTCRTWVKTRWWLIQMMPMVRKLTA